MVSPQDPSPLERVTLGPSTLPSSARLPWVLEGHVGTIVGLPLSHFQALALRHVTATEQHTGGVGACSLQPPVPWGRSRCPPPWEG